MDTARGLEDGQLEDGRSGDGQSDDGRIGSRHDDARGDSTEAGVNDAMFDLGGDERRMHVRAYNHWVSLLKGRPYPTIADLHPGSIADFGPHSTLLDFSTGTDDPRIAYLGSALREECGLVGPIDSIADVPGRSLLSRLTDHYLQIIANRAPIGFEAEFINSRGRTTLYRGILMPFSSHDDGIDFIYGVINWKEMVDAETQATLDAELGAELGAAVRNSTLPIPVVEATSAPAPAPVASAGVPVWADGPSAGFDREPRIEPQFEQQPELESRREALPMLELVDPLLDGPLPESAPLSGGVLGDRLLMARESAAAVRAADARSRAALYRALGRAHDFALATDGDSKGYAALLVDACIAVQARAPMTPIVKLVFGVDYDKTRLAEFAAVLIDARARGIGVGDLPAFLETYPGGIKAIVAVERAQGGVAGRAKPASIGERAVLAHVAIDSGAQVGDTVVLVARVGSDGGLDIVGAVANDKGLCDRAVRAIG